MSTSGNTIAGCLWRALLAGVLACAPATAALADPPPNRLIDRAAYAEHLRVMWLAEIIANWTGVRTEGSRSSPPFFTDADWNTNPFPDRTWLFLNYELVQDPWPADDDTDIEYVYLHTLSTLGVNRLSPPQIRDAWIQHINRYIWVSDYAARQLMGVGVEPPMSALAQQLHPVSPGDHALQIDAQLTTEFFGALCPGMPERALDMADLPIRTTARGYAAHAAQFYVVLYSLASQVDQSLSRHDQVVWLVTEARKYIPDTSKAADVIDFVLADYLANPDKNNWESTRDKMYLRYQANALANGFAYRDWYESSLNLGTGTLALLCGELDLGRTIQIGMLSGWDSDNGTATMGGLIGLIRGQAAIDEQGWTNLSDAFWITRTRDNLPDYTPDQPGEDTFTLMSRRMLPITDREVLAAGGLVDSGPGPTPSGHWLLPPGGAGPGVSKSSALLHSPTQQEFLRSANLKVLMAGGHIDCSTSVPGSPNLNYGSFDLSLMADGIEDDWRGLEELQWHHVYYTTQRDAGNPPGVPQTITVHYDRPVEVQTVRFIGGMYFTAAYTPNPAVQGGWFQTLSPEVQVNGQWIAPPLSSAGAPASVAVGPDKPFPLIDFVLQTPVQATGIRVSGLPGGTASFVTCFELDALAAPAPVLPQLFDRNGDGRLDIEDLYAFVKVPADLNADGLIDGRDRDYLEAALRFGELKAMASGR